jgi:hypothetical protein
MIVGTRGKLGGAVTPYLGGFFDVTKLFAGRLEQVHRSEFVALSWHGFYTCERAGGRADGEEGR